MDALYRTPLLDCFRRGEAAADIRLLAAQGVLAPRAHEQLALLTLLVGDSVPSIREAAERTLAAIPRGALTRFLARPDVPAELTGFFAGRGVRAEGDGIVSADDPLVVAGPDGIAPVDASVVAAEPAGDTSAAGAADVPGAGADSAEDTPRLATVQRLARMTVTEKVKAAMRGSREERAILIRDPNKLVAISVLASPKLTDQEVENVAKMSSVSEDVLRVIGTTRAWTKNYTVIRALAFNPKAPISITMALVSRLVEKDVRGLASDRNVPEPVKILARKLMQAGQSRKH